MEGLPKAKVLPALEKVMTAASVLHKLQSSPVFLKRPSVERKRVARISWQLLMLEEIYLIPLNYGIQYRVTNDLTNVRTEEAKPCFALSKNDSYLISTSGGQVSLFSIATFKVSYDFQMLWFGFKYSIFLPELIERPDVAFYPHDNNIIAIGMDDSTVLIYDTRANEVKSILKGHSKPITLNRCCPRAKGNLLVSAGEDDQIIVWQCNKWISNKSSFLQLPTGTATKKLSEIEVQFHQDQIHFLVVHELKLAVYETIKLECVVQATLFCENHNLALLFFNWPVPKMSAPISHATFSCNSQLVYAAFLDGTVCIFYASNLRPRCLINSAAYLPSNTSHVIYPLVVATNPNEPNQFALGLTDGTVHVYEPLESDSKWGEKSQPKAISSASIVELAIMDISHLEETEVEKHLAFPSLEMSSLEPEGLVEIAGDTSAWKNRIKTSVFLQRIGVLHNNVSTLCVFCKAVNETVDHVMVSCPFVWNVWAEMLNWWDVQGALPGSVEVLILWWDEECFSNKERKIWRGIPLVVLWSVWKLRNDVVFNASNPSLAELCEVIKVRVCKRS
ncbi:hypothetical protein HYC85_027383 [Camellia sinensis]|uniref:Reverse transcriptase zinc-binding domain-containing protein n=1 Tax=Camellia sinensis TaxID=4442 RepID=A0A7J7GA72_CAMSI|nr:hypothetical protein HYC85_027383 [Camellia sinensis]